MTLTLTQAFFLLFAIVVPGLFAPLVVLWLEQRGWPAMIAFVRPAFVNVRRTYPAPRMWPMFLAAALVWVLALVVEPAPSSGRRLSQLDRLERIEQVLVEIRDELRRR
jgi:hypothetical protein